MHSKLLINLCFALVGLYVTFIISTVSTGVPVLCGVVSALMHYFFLTVFFWMAAEAIHLHRKLVSVFKPDIMSYVFIAMAICWGMLVWLSQADSIHCHSSLCMTYFAIYFMNVLSVDIHPFYSCSGPGIHCGLLLSSTIPELHPPTIVRMDACCCNCSIDIVG